MKKSLYTIQIIILTIICPGICGNLINDPLKMIFNNKELVKRAHESGHPDNMYIKKFIPFVDKPFSVWKDNKKEIFRCFFASRYLVDNLQTGLGKKSYNLMADSS